MDKERGLLNRTATLQIFNFPQEGKAFVQNSNDKGSHLGEQQESVDNGALPKELLFDIWRCDLHVRALVL